MLNMLANIDTLPLEGMLKALQRLNGKIFAVASLDCISYNPD